MFPPQRATSPHSVRNGYPGYWCISGNIWSDEALKIGIYLYICLPLIGRQVLSVIVAGCKVGSDARVSVSVIQ